MSGLEQARSRMQDAGIHPRAIDVFADFYRQLADGATGMIAEADVDPLDGIDHAASVDVSADQAREAAARTVVIKLNGGLGTSMGLDRAKSLLQVRPGLSFLDVIVQQVQAVRTSLDVRLPLLFMNSFRTRDDTLAALAKYSDLAVAGLPLDFLQSSEPKLRQDTLAPVDWPADPSLEWCPPGHGDLYTSLDATGILDELLAQGFEYATVSNADNLGAVPDPQMMGWFAATGAPYAAEVCRRTPADVKGGHLVVRRADGRLVLRETAQTPPEDADAAADATKHRYFHTNNLWFNLRALRETLTERNGVLGLPLIRNLKTVDPSDPASTPVVQIESAMGAAIEVFDGATAIEVDRSRFLPVKTTNDLLLLRSDVYGVGADGVVRALVDAPLIDLDRRFYSTIADFDARIPAPPSLMDARSFTVQGDWHFGRDVVVRGDVELNDSGKNQSVATGERLEGS